jgi:phosphocarrier protein HPr
MDNALSDLTPDQTSGQTPDLTRTVKIANRKGLHARAAAKFVKTAERFSAEVIVERVEPADLQCAGERVSGRSIMGLMMLAAGPGTMLDLSATGPDAAAAIEALAQLIDAKFDED